MGAVSPRRCHVYILDTISVSESIETILQATSNATRWIALVPPPCIDTNFGKIDEQLRLLHLGVGGIVEASDSCEEKLLTALRAVNNGRLCAGSKLLSEYFRRRGAIRAHLASASARLTAREAQVFELMLWGFSNKHIAATFKLTRRTVKFHITNILSELSSESRMALIGKRGLIKVEQTLDWAS
jgi:DNA-binding NarL/FixJ family response regulator